MVPRQHESSEAPWCHPVPWFCVDSSRRPGRLRDIAPRSQERVWPRAVRSTPMLNEGTRLPAPYPSWLHQEKSHTKDYLARIAFYCREAARRGGETIIGDTRQRLADLPPGLVERLIAKRILYRRNFVANSERTNCAPVPFKLLQCSWIEWLFHVGRSRGREARPRSGARDWCSRVASLHMNERVPGGAFAEIQLQSADGRCCPATFATATVRQ